MGYSLRAFIGDLDLKFVAGDDFESLNGIADADKDAIRCRNLLRLLMMGWSQDWSQLISWDAFKAVFVQRNPHLLKNLRFAFQQGFDYLYQQLRDRSFDEMQQQQIQLYLSNCLSLLPYADLTPYESISIPQYLNEQWTQVKYFVQPIELTRFSQMPGSGFNDRVYAYGLESITHADASAHLIFMGTTYPAGQGYLAQINTDMEGYTSVGQTQYLSGRANILSWLQQQKSKVHVCGLSLGASLSLLLAIDQGPALSRVDALNPAGLHLADISGKHDAWNKLDEKPQVFIQRQGADPVSSFGEWIADWTLIQVNPPVQKKGPNGLVDHGLNYAGLAGTTFTPVAIDDDNQQRKLRNFWIYFLGRSAVYFALIVPYTYVIRPIVYFLYQHSIHALALLTITVLAAVYTASLFVAAGVAIAALGLTAYLAYSATEFSQTNQRVKQHSSSLNELTYPPIHAPEAPRNACMDLYNSEQNVGIELTLQQLHSYYYLMRCLVKNKEFIPAIDGTKKELLLQCQQYESTYNVENSQRDCIESNQPMLKPPSGEPAENCLIRVEKTQAKVVHMRRALRFIEQLGQDNIERLKQTLSQEYNRYQMGKVSG